MANELLLINPRRRRRRKSPVKRRARRRNPNGNNNARRTVARATGARTGLTRRANPRRRVSYSRRPARRRAMARYQRNPAKRMTMRSVMNNVVIPAAQAGAGALALDVLWGYVPVPMEWKTGNLRHVVKGGGAIVLGMVAQQMLGAQLGRNIALGALTVTFHDAMRDMVAQFAPNIPLGYVGAGFNAGNYGGPNTFNYPAGGTTQADTPTMGMYVAPGGPAAQGPAPARRESETMAMYTSI